MTALVRPELAALDTGTLTRAEQVAKAFLLGYGNKRTRAAYTYDLREWFAWCETMNLDPLDAHRVHVEAHARYLEAAEARPASVARRLAALAGYYQYAEDEGAIDKNPAKRARRPKVSDASQRLGLDKTQARALLAAASEDPKDHLVICLLLYNGLRASEVAGGRFEHLDTQRGHRTLWLLGKGGKEEIVPLPPPTIEALDRYLALRGPHDGPLFLNRAGRQMTRQNVDGIVRRLGRRIGLPLRPHDLRHTAVTLQLEAGVPLQEAQDFARHADPRTTQRYNRARFQLDKHAAYRLAGYLG